MNFTCLDAMGIKWFVKEFIKPLRDFLVSAL